MFVCNSAKYSDLGQPFGYLKASTALNCVNLFVMPYNYPVLLPLLGETTARAASEIGGSRVICALLVPFEFALGPRTRAFVCDPRVEPRQI